MTSITLRHRDILYDQSAVHLARAQLSARRPVALHQHDFYEMFWVQNGQLRHHQPDGVSTLSEGSVGFIRPQDKHGLQGRGEHALIVSLTFDPSLIAALGARHKSLAGHLFWADAPQIIQLDTAEMIALNQAALTLETGPRDLLSAEAFLLPVCTRYCQPIVHNAPEWLTHAMAAAQSPDVFRRGAAGLVAVAGQTHAHVSRTMKRLTGQSPSAYITEQRMTYAARQLTGTSETLADIAADIGVPNLSHFHKLFREQFDQTPHQYRRKYQRDVVQPVQD